MAYTLKGSGWNLMGAAHYAIRLVSHCHNLSMKSTFDKFDYFERRVQMEN